MHSMTEGQKAANANQRQTGPPRSPEKGGTAELCVIQRRMGAAR